MKDKSSKNILKIAIIAIILVLVIAGGVYAGITIYDSYKEANMLPTYTGKIGNTDTNSVWVGTFQLAWNEFLDQRIGGTVEFEDGKSILASELNKRSFTKDMLSADDYYTKVGETTPKLKTDILQDIKNKFRVENSSLLDNINFTSQGKNRSYTIYSMLFKKFTFAKQFDKLNALNFGYKEESYADQFEIAGEENINKNNIKYIQYFGINNASSEDLNSGVDVLFYNNNSDFAVKLKTKEGEELLLYRTNNIKSFDETYSEMIQKGKDYTGSKKFEEPDELRVPYIGLDTIINYDELCGRNIKGTNGLYIANAIQNVKFSLNEKGGNLVSEAGIKDMYLSLHENARYFYLNDKFVLFLKEEDKEQPYFALRVDNTDMLVQYDR